MKKMGLLSVFLIIALSLPLALSVLDKMNGSFAFYELFEESQNEERESEEKENFDDAEEVMLVDSFILSFSNRGNMERIIKNIIYKNILKDVLTPPPNLT